MEYPMTNDLLEKAQALLEAREKAEPSASGLIDREARMEYAFLAANTACETIQGYQDLLRQMADAIERLIAGNLDMDELGEAKLLLEEARTALHHTTTNA
jgi:hypothetical protein